MSLQYVTQKLKTQSLAEDEEQNERPPIGEDSGTESDDDMDASHSHQAEPEAHPDPSDHKPKEETERAELLSVLNPDKPVLPNPRDSGALCDDNYSSEEELKEINSSENKKTYVDPVVEPDIPKNVSAQTAEKRKWSKMIGQEGAATVGQRASSNGSSGDEEVIGYLHPSPSCSSTSSGRGGLSEDTPTPVQFCTSPPAGVYRPNWQHENGGSSSTRSPPPKLFHMSSQDHTHGPGLELRDSAKSLRPEEVTKGNNQRPSSASDVLMSGGLGAWGSSSGKQVSCSSASSSQGCISTGEEIRLRFSGSGNEAGGRHQPPSPHKRHRSRTPRPQNLQRPCLDFEKMQQIKKRVVTSWRPQGTELSLFCW